jgi:MoxR-like ATPase
MSPDLERMARSAILFLNQSSTLVPCLWGPSSEGKTHFVRSLSQEIDALFLHVILQGLKPDDALGAQVMTLEGRLVVAPSWWFEATRRAVQEGRKVVVFLDELDKVDPEITASVLTFLRDRTAFGIALEDEEAVRRGERERLVYLVAACNPGAMDEALRRRLAFIWWPTDIRRYYLAAGASELARLAVEANAQALAERRQQAEPPPAPDFTLASLDALARGQARLLRLPKEERAFLLSLLMPREAAAEVERKLLTLSLRPEEQLDYLLEHPEEATRVLAHLPVPELVATGASLVLHAYHAGQLERLPEAFLAVLRGAIAPALERPGDPQAQQEALLRLSAWLGERPDKEELERACQEAVQRLGPDPFFAAAARDGLVVYRQVDGLPAVEGKLVELCRALASGDGRGHD